MWWHKKSSLEVHQCLHEDGCCEINEFFFPRVFFFLLNSKLYNHNMAWLSRFHCTPTKATQTTAASSANKHTAASCGSRASVFIWYLSLRTNTSPTWRVYNRVWLSLIWALLSNGVWIIWIAPNVCLCGSPAWWSRTMWTQTTLALFN